MKTVKEVLKKWEENSQATQTVKKIPVHLSMRDSARIRALSELFTGFSEERVITDLISAALDEIEEALPYVKGSKVVAEDEFGDPIYEDVGMTPEFERLTNKYTALWEKEKKNL